MPYFVVVNEAGGSWVDSRPMREQSGWTAHAQFVNALAAENFVVLGGPLSGGPRHRALLIVQAEDEATARARLAEDPWIRSGILRLSRLDPWEILVSNDRLDPVLAEIAARSLRR